MDQEKVQEIRVFQLPKDAKGVSRFIGMANFYRRSIPNAVEVALN